MNLSTSLPDFISLHYQGGREDTPFWKHMTNNKIVTPFTKTVIEHAKTKVPSVTSYQADLFTTAPICLWNWTLAGLNLLTPEVAKASLEATGREKLAKMWLEEYFRRLG
jgi:hypothetical protein